MDNGGIGYPVPDDKTVRDLSEMIYRDQLGKDDVKRMIAKDEDQGEKLRARAGFYDPVSRAALKLMREHGLK